MPSAKKTTENTTFSNVKAKRLRKKKPINSEMMVDIKPLTPSQETVFEYWNNKKNLFMYGAAGTGKTFVALYLALNEVLKNDSPYEKVYIVRSLVSTREIGFLPATMRINHIYIKYHTLIW